MHSRCSVPIFDFLHARVWDGSTLASFALDPIGTWSTRLTEEGKEAARVADCGGAFCATIISLKKPNDPKTGVPKTESNSVDASKRNRSIVGLQILMALQPQGANKWAVQVCIPEDGKTYDATGRNISFASGIVSLAMFSSGAHPPFRRPGCAANCSADLTGRNTVRSFCDVHHIASRNGCAKWEPWSPGANR
jgi:uncharacterized protein (DUF2147 family)